MAVPYKTYEFQIYDLISRFSQLLPKGMEETALWRKRTEELKKNLEQKKFRIAVVGEFNRGKTSFVNALLGKVILPADYVPTTATINRITYSDTPAAYIRLKDGRRQEVEISQLAGYVTKLTKESELTAADIEEAVVEYPSLLCRNDVDLIDTPGMNDEEAMNAVTISKLTDIDLAIVAVDPTLPFSMTECKFTAQLLESPQICQIIVVITKMDTVREREREKTVQYLEERIGKSVEEYLLKYHEADSEILQKYHDIFDCLHLFPVSALDALDALACNDMEQFEKSGFLELNNQLPQIIMTSQNRSVILTSIRNIQQCMEEYRKWLKGRMDQRRAAMPYLEALKQTFSQTGRSLTKNMFLAAKQGLLSTLPNPERETAFIRNKFIQALTAAGPFGYGQLKQAFSFIMGEVQESCNKTLVQKERAFWDVYISGTLELKAGGVYSGLNRLLQPYGDLHRTLKPKIMEFYKDCQAIIADIRSGKDRNLYSGNGLSGEGSFQWAFSPLPPEAEARFSQNIISRTDNAIYASMVECCRREKEWKQRSLEQYQRRLDESMEKLIREADRETEAFLRQLETGGTEGRLLAKVSELEESCSRLKEEFLEELE